MKRNKKIWMFVILAIVNLIVILSFIFLTKLIRNSDDLKLDSTHIPSTEGIFYF